MKTLPLWVRKALIDAIEGSVAAVGALAIAYPLDLTQAKQQALVLSVAVGGAVIAAFRRAFLERGLEWVRGKILPEG